jgi:L-serine deaminase
MDNDNLPDSGSPAGSGHPDPGKAVLAVNGVIVAVGGTYASTHSLVATVVAGCAGLACAALFAWKK